MIDVAGVWINDHRVASHIYNGTILRTRGDTSLFTQADFHTINEAALPSGERLLRFWGIAQPMLFESYFQGDEFIITRIPLEATPYNRSVYKFSNRTLTRTGYPYK